MCDLLEAKRDIKSVKTKKNCSGFDKVNLNIIKHKFTKMKHSIVPKKKMKEVRCFNCIDSDKCLTYKYLVDKSREQIKISNENERVFEEAELPFHIHIPDIKLI